MKKIIAKPEAAWLMSAALACAILAASLFVPLWQMELVAPQYPVGLRMYAYGDHFEGDPNTYYDDIREINGLNHYIGMKEIKPVTEMDLFTPGIVATIVGTLAVSFIAWRRGWFRALVIGGFWFMPVFFIADLQYWLYNYGHTLNEKAALNTGSFTPKVIGETKVWNFHSDNAFELGFYLMVLAAVVVTFLPPAIGWVQSRRFTERRTHTRVGAPGTPQTVGR